MSVAVDQGDVPETALSWRATARLVLEDEIAIRTVVLFTLPRVVLYHHVIPLALILHLRSLLCICFASDYNAEYVGQDKRTARASCTILWPQNGRLVGSTLRQDFLHLKLFRRAHPEATLFWQRIVQAPQVE